MMPEATNEAKEMTADAVGAGPDERLGGWMCLPPTQNITMKATAVGIQAKLSYLNRGVNRVSIRQDDMMLPVYYSVSKESHL
jgi:hypothetical protein